MTETTTIGNDHTRCEPVICYEGDNPVYTIVKPGVTTIANDGTLTMWIYKGSTDSSSTYLTGSMSASGNAATTKTFTALVSGEYFVGLRGTCDGQLITFATFPLYVRKKSGR